MLRRRVVVHGGVQGIGFRYSARREADRLGVAGWIRNRSDGAVEAEVEGDAGAVQAMLDWLAAGPPGARVEGTETAEVDPIGDHVFRITG
jgi:acylphosphatase